MKEQGFEPRAIWAPTHAISDLLYPPLELILPSELTLNGQILFQRFDNDICRATQIRIKKMDSGERRVEGPNRCLHWRQRKKEMRKAGEWRGGSRQQRGDGENQQDLKKEQMEMEGCKKEEFIKEGTGLSLEQGLQNQIPTEPSKYHKWAKWVRYKVVGSHGVCSKLRVHAPSKEGTYCSCESMGSQCGQLPGLRRKISSKFKFLYKNLLVFKCWKLIQILKRKKNCAGQKTHILRLGLACGLPVHAF